MSIYENNIAFLKSRFPQFLERLNSITPTRSKIETARNGSLTLSYVQNGTPFYFHSKFNPEGECTQVLKNKNIQADHIVVMGLGLGYHLEKIMTEKDKLTKVLLIEPDFEIVLHSLHVLRWDKWLNRRDFVYLIGLDLSSLPALVPLFIDMVGFDTVEFIEWPAETRMFQPFFAQARDILDKEIKTYIYDFKTRLVESYTVSRNILKNYPLILKTRPLTRLKDRFSGVPGIIISAGPSLDKNLLLLKKIKDRAVFIAVDTALKPLLKRSIQPHFTAIGDPSHKNYLHIQGTESELLNFVLAEAGIAHNIFKDFTDRIFSLSIGKPIVKVLEEHSEPLGNLEGWGSVISIALEAAVYMGLDPIVFIGQDFAFSDSRNHCRGTSWEDNKIEYSGRLDEIQRFEKNSIGGEKQVIETIDIYGNKTFTSDRMLLYKNYLARLVSTHPNTRFINATQGGIFTEIPSMPLYDIIKSSVFGTLKIDFKELNQLPLIGNKENARRLIDFVSKTKKTFEDYLKKINEIETFLGSHTNGVYSVAEAVPLLQKLEETHFWIYSDSKNGDILEMWSTAPVYELIKEQKRIRNNELDDATASKGVQIYRQYFSNIRPVVDDIIKRFERTLKELKETSGSLPF